MVFLLFAILSSSVLAVVLKYLNAAYSYGVYFVNYVTCAALAFLTLEEKSLYNGDPAPLWLGAIAGFFYLASLTASGYSIHKNGAVLSSVFTRLGCWCPLGCPSSGSGSAPRRCRPWAWPWRWPPPW